MVKNKSSVKASNTPPVIGCVIAELAKESLKNNSHLFLNFHIIMIFQYVSASVAVL